MYNAMVTETSIAQCSHTMDGGRHDLIAMMVQDLAGVVCQTGVGKKDKYLLHYNCTNINKSKAII